jgi:hypothetical protein
MAQGSGPGAEARRLYEDAQRQKDWKRWGPYLAERQWGTVREDCSTTGECWGYFPHDHARRRSYRWGEDGLLGICDRQGRLSFAIALWNGRDPILKERLPERQPLQFPGRGHCYGLTESHKGGPHMSSRMSSAQSRNGGSGAKHRRIDLTGRNHLKC